MALMRREMSGRKAMRQCSGPEPIPELDETQEPLFTMDPNLLATSGYTDMAGTSFPQYQALHRDLPFDTIDYSQPQQDLLAQVSPHNLDPGSEMDYLSGETGPTGYELLPQTPQEPWPWNGSYTGRSQHSARALSLPQPSILQSSPGLAPTLHGQNHDQYSETSYGTGNDLQGPGSEVSFDVGMNRVRHGRVTKSLRGMKHNCPETNCGADFSTQNDLDRHTRGVHGKVEPGSKIWICPFTGCSSVGKKWSRFDNFKQHVSRMHPSRDAEDLDRLGVNYDPSVHGSFDKTTNRGRGARRSNSNSAARPTERSVNVLHNTPETQGSLTQRMGVFLHPEQYNNFIPKSQIGDYVGASRRGGPATVANPQDLPQLGFQYSPSGDSTASMPMQTDENDLRTVGANFEDVSIPTENPSLFSNPHLDLAQPTNHRSVEQILQDHIRSMSEEGRLELLKHCTGSVNAQVPDAKPADGTKAFKCKRHMTNSTRPCQSSFAKKSELRKHEFRHDRRFQCTFKECYKRMGTKWELRRHETKRHLQDHKWLCLQMNKSGEKCATLFDKKEQFKEHCKEVHGCTTILGWIARRFAGPFFCGFCNDIIQCTAAGEYQDRERYDHITSHLTIEKRDMDNWKPVDGGGKTKQELKKEADERHFKLAQVDHDDDEEDNYSDIDDDDTTTEQPAEDLRSIDTDGKDDIVIGSFVCTTCGFGRLPYKDAVCGICEYEENYLQSQYQYRC